MLTIHDVFDDPEMIDEKVITMLKEVMEANGIDENTLVLYPSDKNNDVNGSQHHDHPICFTYRDAEIMDVDDCVTAGYYEYFSAYEHADDDEKYTGNQYEGRGEFFDAVVVDPPDYAATHTVWD